ncbi:MAG: 4-diphosphocytidyl-2C-methyl-D-erythritol kinase [Hyphomicrobiales bacterium]|nr:4-diphosphocytidyl-2C-methyl-D-erythritol kinase [Hyphomicrobiales bacterium]
MSEVAAIVLAAGKASRFRAAAGDTAPVTKLVAHYDGKALVRHVVEAAHAARLSPVIVVTGHAREAVLAELNGLDVRPVHNSDYETGMASSLKAGLAQCPPSAHGVVVLLGDMPLVGPALIDTLTAAFEAHPEALAVVPSFAGERGNPVLISAHLFPALAALHGDAGARQVLRGLSDGVLEVAVSDEAARVDIDTPDALRDLARPFSSDQENTP